MVDCKKKGTIVVFEDLALIVDVKVFGNLTPATVAKSMERRGKSVRIAELRAEYSASGVDKELSLFR